MTDASYPRQKARTRGFQLGRPRSFQILADGSVLFLRSASGVDPRNDLWIVRAGTAAEEVLVRVADLSAGEGLPAAERARRERLREVTSGITAFSTDDAGRYVAFTVGGTGFWVDVASGQVHELPTPAGIVDARLSPSGDEVAYVHDGALFRIGRTDAAPRLVRAPAGDSETWGLVDFLGAEEFNRFRGYWWIDDRLLVERCIESDVPTMWIGDPSQPDREPVLHRYPRAGTNNPQIELWLIEPDGTGTQLERDMTEFPYLAAVHTDNAVVLSFLTRDQRRMCIERLDAHTGECSTLRVLEDPCWVDVHIGTPTLDADGQLLTIEPHDAVNRLCREGVPITPPDLQITGLIGLDATGATVLAQQDPTVQSVVHIAADGIATAHSPDDAWSSGLAKAQVLVTATATLDEPGTAFTITTAAGTVPIRNLAEVPYVHPHPIIETCTDRHLPTALLLPSTPGTHPLPVILSPYGGPHGQRVIRANGAYATEQWIADHGFAVVIIDGAGTPGRGPVEERLVHHDLATPVLADQVAALADLAQRYPQLDLTRVGIRGWSFGGYLAALAVLDRPDVFHAAVAGAPVTEWSLYDTAYTERYLGDPREHPEHYVQTSLLERAATLTRPLLLIHGLADDNVLAAHTLQLSAALLAAGRTHEVLPLSGVTHMTPQEEVAEHLLNREMAFFRTHLA
jgi:dipeptidyl-peptidase 4